MANRTVILECIASEILTNPNLEYKDLFRDVKAEFDKLDKYENADLN